MDSEDIARRLGPDRLLVPLRAEGPGGLIGDGVAEIGPDHPLYEHWAQYLDRRADGSGPEAPRS